MTFAYLLHKYDLSKTKILTINSNSYRKRNIVNWQKVQSQRQSESFTCFQSGNVPKLLRDLFPGQTVFDTLIKFLFYSILFPSKLYKWKFLEYYRGDKLDYLNPLQTDATLLTNNSQNQWMLHVAFVCTYCCMLIRVVGSYCAKFQIGQAFDCQQYRDQCVCLHVRSFKLTSVPSTSKTSEFESKRLLSDASNATKVDDSAKYKMN